MADSEQVSVSAAGFAVFSKLDSRRRDSQYLFAIYKGMFLKYDDRIPVATSGDEFLETIANFRFCAFHRAFPGRDMFNGMIVRRKDLLFEIKIPNDETMARCGKRDALFVPNPFG
jgi:hypothetical protein